MLPEVSLTGLVLVAAVAFAAPMLLGLAPRLRLPAVVLEILAGIAIGPSGLNWVRPDCDRGAGPHRPGDASVPRRHGDRAGTIRGRLLRVSILGFGISLAAGVLLGLGLRVPGLVGNPLLFAIALSATSLGLIIPVLKDAGRLRISATRRRRGWSP